MKRRDIALAAALLPFASIFAGSTAFAADAGNLKKLRVGVTAGPAAEILEQVVPLAKAKGLDIQIFEFQDYIQPNAALDSGDLDANIFQTIPFMEQTIKDRGYHLSVAGKGFTLPMAFYSKKVKSFAEAPKGATVGIPNDPAMGGRALFLLEKGGVIKLRKGVGYTPSVLDIVENPKDLKFVELEAAQLPHSLNDLTISAVNGNYAYVANLNPTRDGILVEDADGPYVCNIVVNTKDLGKPWVPLGSRKSTRALSFPDSERCKRIRFSNGLAGISAKSAASLSTRGGRLISSASTSAPIAEHCGNQIGPRVVKRNHRSFIKIDSGFQST